MGKRGPRRLPTATLKMRVGKVYKRKGRAGYDPDNEPTPDAATPDPPFKLDGVALEQWQLLTAELPKTFCLSKQDAGSLALACRALQAAEKGEKWGFDEWRRFSAMFGLSPSDRASMTVAAAKVAKVGARDRDKDRKAG